MGNYATSVSIPLCFMMGSRKRMMSRVLFSSNVWTREENPRVRCLAMISRELFRRGAYLPAIAGDEASTMRPLPAFTAKVEPITCPVKTALPPASCSNSCSSPARK